MLVEMIETSPDIWTWRSTDGLEWSNGLMGNIKPVEATQQVDSKAVTKALIKLKEVGFTADEMIDLKNAGLLYAEGD